MYEFHTSSSIVNNFLAELRDVEIQKDPHRFRRNLKRLGSIMAYEISKTFQYKSVRVTTPLGFSEGYLLSDAVVLATILRAGLPFYEGFSEVFDSAESAFIGAYRAEGEDVEGVRIEMGYMSAPALEGKVLILIDPMLATGSSLLKSFKALTKHGIPQKLIIAAAIASQPGVDFVKEHLPQADLFLGAVDPELNDKAYIVPGLGDAGDLAFGKKL